MTQGHVGNTLRPIESHPPWSPLGPLAGSMLTGLLLVCGCGDPNAGPELDASPDGATSLLDAAVPDAAVTCVDAPPTVLDPTLGILSDEFDALYDAFDLGPLPLPVGESDPTFFDPLGGCTIDPADSNRLLFVANSERAQSAVYAVEIERDACGHIRGYSGRSEHVLDVPYADANFVPRGDGSLFVSQYPIAGVAHIDLDFVTPAFSLRRTVDLIPLGVNGPAVNGSAGQSGESPGGIASVPEFLASRGELRFVGFPSGRWFHASTDASDVITAVTATRSLKHGPGGIAYVPPGSRGFPNASVIVAEWLRETETGAADGRGISVYEVDQTGDPIVETRREFFEHFQNPWGGYFDPTSGDFLFLSWRRAPDRIVAVRGFTPLI